MDKIGFIGCGNMGGALARAVAKRVDPSCIMLANRTAAKAEKTAAEIGASSVSNTRIASECKWIFLGVKPQMMEAVLDPLGGTLASRADRFILVTMAAGLPIARIREFAGVNAPVVRILPNTPVAVGAGVVSFCADGLEPAEDAEFADMLAGAGVLERVPEYLMNAACSVAGCGPAWAYQFIDALADGGAACGLPREQAVRQAAQMMLGAARLALESGRTPEELRIAVCSPGGSTIEGVKHLEEGGFRDLVAGAVEAAYRRNVELGGK